MLTMPSKLVACPSCEQHVREVEAACPHCGAALRDSAGRLVRSASAALLGLAAVATACGPTVEGPDTASATTSGQSGSGEPLPEYGPAVTTGVGASGQGGAGGYATTSVTSSGHGGSGGEPLVEYGPAPTTGVGAGGQG